jgi:peptide/nickel transport system substrate-binding protein
VLFNYAEAIIMLDKDNNVVPCLAKDWRWTDHKTIEFRLREDVWFHNGEKFNANALRINWEEYRQMESPRPNRFLVLPDETVFESIDEYTVRFTLPKPDGLAMVKFLHFVQIAPGFFAQHKFDENSYGYLPEAGPWGTGPFRMIGGNLRFAKPTDRLFLEAYERYWEPRYPKVQRVEFDNTLIGNREEAMRLCREEEGAVDIVSHIRPLDTLKVAESPFAKVVKSRDVSALIGVFNLRKTDSKWRDVRLRKAVNYAVNREELWKYGAKGNAYNLGGHIPPGAYGHNPNLTLFTYDSDKARALLIEAGYPKGFEMKISTYEAWKLEAQIISKMLERIGLKAKFEALPFPEFMRKVYIPFLDRPEKQDWDIILFFYVDWFSHTGGSFLPYFLIEESDQRWIEYDPVYEEMWRDMAMTFDSEAQEEKVKDMEQYIYDQAYHLFIYSPISLYAANKEVNLIPQKSLWLRLKETSVTDSHWSVRDQE